jgi:tetratricopeptide (TPR) repeat protein
VESSFFVEVLAKVLELAPCSRWPLDRVKLALGSQARWDDLFRLYDRAIDATASESERAELLDEAAFAARDLASDPERAMGYLESIHAMRPDDAAASAALERLYERQGKKADLIELLAGHAGRSDGATRHQLQRRIADLRLDLGQVAEASAVVEAMLEEGAPVVDVANLLERLASHPGQLGAIERLCAYYESAGRLDDAANMAKSALEQAESPDERARRVRDLVRLRVSTADGAPGVFARVMASFESEIAGNPALAAHVYRGVLLSAITAWKQAPTDTDFQDAADGAWQAAHALKSALLNAGDARRACRLLERTAHLPFERDRRRELLEEAVSLCAEGPGDSKQSIRLYSEIFEDYAEHPYAVASLDRFAGLLEAAGENGKLARLWERQAQNPAGARDDANRRAFWARAAAAWERQGSDDRAVAAYERAAALGSDAAFEALARIYRSRSQWTEAARALEWLYAHTPESARGGHALLLAESYIGLDRRDLARFRLEDALRSAPTSAEASEMRARLMAMYRCESSWAHLASMLSDEGRRSDSPARKVAFFREAAAVLQDKLDQPADAAAALESAVDADPRDHRLRLELAQMLERLGQWPRAAAVLKDSIAVCGDACSKDRALLHQRLGCALSRSNDLEGALAQLRVAAGLQPADPLIMNDLGRIALDAGRLDVAASAYRTLLLALRHPTAQGGALSRSQVVLNLSRIALLRGDQSQAVSLLDSALNEALDGGEDPEAFEKALREMGRNDLVARSLERRIERTPSLTSRAVALGNWVDLWLGPLQRDPEIGRRVRHYTEMMLHELAEERSAGSPVWSALWSVLVRLEETAELRRLEPLLQGAIATMEPGADRAQLRLHLARARIADAGFGDEAIALLSSALDEDPSQTEAGPLLAGLLEREGRFDELANLLERRLARIGQDTPEFAEVARDLGHALERAGRRDDAMRLYESILDSRPTRVETVNMIADRLEALESPRFADCCELRMSLDPHASRGLALRLVELRAARGDATGLVRALELGLTADPTNRVLIDRLAHHHEEQGDWPAVVRVLGSAMDAAPNDRALFLRVVEAHRKMGATAEVLRLLDGAIGAKESDAELLGLRAAVREGAGDAEGAVSDLLRLGATDARLREVAGDYERLAGLMAARAETMADGPQKSALLLRAANLLTEHVGTSARAVPFVERARSACPESIEAGLAWARVQADLGRSSEALPVLLEVVARNRGKRLPALSGVYLEIGKAHLAADDLVEAFDALKAGFAVDPRGAELATLLGLLAIDLDDDKTAERALLAVATARKAGAGEGSAGADRVTAIYHLAAMADARGEVSKALRWATTAITEDPTHAGARALLDKLAARAPTAHAHAR